MKLWKLVRDWRMNTHPHGKSLPDIAQFRALTSIVSLWT